MKKQGSGFASPLAFVQAADAPKPVAPLVAPKPWDHLDPEKNTKHLATISEVDKAKLAYLTDRVPGAKSVNHLIRDGIAMVLEKHRALLEAPDVG